MLPRPVIPGRVHLVTRRCTQRQFLLRPDDHVERIYLYCLGVAAERYKVTLYGWIVMSNHVHLIVRDNLGNYPDFLAYLNKLTAKALNVHWGRWENLWATEQANVVHLLDAEACFEKLLYTLMNPVNGDLVEHAVDWPGASSLSLNLSGGEKTVSRPKQYFRPEDLGGRMPPEVTLRVERLPGFERLTDDEWKEMLLSAIRRDEEAARERRRKEGKQVLGRRAVREASHTSTPDTVAPRRRLRPSVACKDAERRKRALAELSSFRKAYRSALKKWVARKRRVEFPPGTYRLRRLGARCAALTIPQAATQLFIQSS